jgi:hypothetical protein
MEESVVASDEEWRMKTRIYVWLLSNEKSVVGRKCGY